MADDRHYVPGDFYRICDLTGFKIRANRTRKQWNNYIVRDQSFELRQPQDFVRGVRDDQTVPEPRPRQVNVFLQNQTTVASPSGDFLPADFLSVDFSEGQASYPPGSTIFAVANSSIFTVGDKVSVMQNNGAETFARVTNVDLITPAITIDRPTTWFVSGGNIIFDLTYPQLQPYQFPASSGNY